MVECCDGSFYTGWTTDPKRRAASHNAGRGAKYTRSRRPVRLVYCEAHETKHDAMSREVKIKQLTHAEKREMIAGWKMEE
ncbi:MAG: GIY-YIG nuclease family protein [Eubacterium sp.]|nr:GIY-YIG nuclease family protein [Eubacterium sp.]